MPQPTRRAGCLSAEPIHDTFAALICQGGFERHENLHVASIECGSGWAASLVRKLEKAYGQMSTEFKRDPVEELRRHCSTATYYAGGGRNRRCQQTAYHCSPQLERQANGVLSR